MSDTEQAREAMELAEEWRAYLDDNPRPGEQPYAALPRHLIALAARLSTLEAALGEVAALRKLWDTATPDDGWDPVAGFWTAVVIADVALAASPEGDKA